MRKFLLLIAASTMLLSCSSGWKQVPDKLEKLVNKVELKAESFTSADWDSIKEEYSDLMDTFNDNIRKYTSAETKRVRRASGKFNGLVLRNGIRNAGSILNDIIDSAPDYLDGLGEALDRTGDSALDAIDYLEDDIDTIGEGLEDLGDDLEDIAERVGDKAEKFLERIGDLF